MERTMVPPRVESENIDYCPIENYRNKSDQIETAKKTPEFYNDKQLEFNRKVNDNTNENTYLFLPSELEVRETGVFTISDVPKGVRYGPFQGVWAPKPQDIRFAWQMSSLHIKRPLSDKELQVIVNNWDDSEDD
ncbi:unnamed protein product [Diabrotica balteata]|uniref:Uncharacterized protein n=1 Tax=Diabrotica balteata TaxID=107213 RepID=A0A9N9SNY4_DIABA|nr:unnamed protein product [Diabrotica balteata]